MTIHGLAKVLESKLPIERIAWFLLILGGFSLAVIASRNIWLEYFENRTNTVYNKYKEINRLVILTRA